MALPDLPAGKSFNQICAETGLSGAEAIRAMDEHVAETKSVIAAMAGVAVDSLHDTGPVAITQLIAKNQGLSQEAM